MKYLPTNVKTESPHICEDVSTYVLSYGSRTDNITIDNFGVQLTSVQIISIGLVIIKNFLKKKEKYFEHSLLAFCRADE